MYVTNVHDFNGVLHKIVYVTKYTILHVLICMIEKHNVFVSY